MLDRTDDMTTMLDDPHERELVAISKSVVMLEQRMAEYKSIVEEHKRLKQSLYEAMDKYGVKSWETPSGAKITRVDAVPATVKMVTQFDEVAFKAENPALYGMYTKDVEQRTSGKSGYVRITIAEV